MSVSVVCRGCGRRVRLPDGIHVHKARCSKCRAKLDPPVPPLAASPTEVLSLDDEPALELDDEPAKPARPPKPPVPPPPPPPFRFAARVVADSGKQLTGTLPAVLTPHGLFLEAAPNRPALFAPVGTPVAPDGPLVVLTLPDRVVTLHLAGVAAPDRLAADAAAFLAGERPVPLPADYRRPWWLVGVGAVLAVALATGPVVLAGVADFSLALGLILGLVFAGLATAANAGIALFTHYPVGGKVALMAGVCGALLAVFLFGAVAYLTGRKHEASQVVVTPPPEAPGVPAPGAPGPPPSPSPLPDPAPPDPGPPSHLDIARRDGTSRLDDGPADVTALALAPDGAAVIGYADGTTRLWPLDQPAFEAPRAGPRGAGAVRHVAFDPTGKLALLSCDRGAVVARLAARSDPALEVPGEFVAVLPEPDRERFAAVRAGKLQIRYVPMNLLKDPAGGRVANGFVVSVPREETLPLNTRPDIPLPPPTFLAWHPAGQLLTGAADGTITAWPPTGATSRVASKDHKAAVRAWAVGPVWPDFATGDAAGVVGVWPNKALTPTTFKAGGAAVKALAFGACGGDLAVADAAGGLAVWNVVTRTRVLEAKRTTPAAAVAFGPADDILLVADGKGVEVLYVPELTP